MRGTIKIPTYCFGIALVLSASLGLAQGSGPISTSRSMRGLHTFVSISPNAVLPAGGILGRKVLNYAITITKLNVDIQVTGIGGTSNEIIRISDGSNNCDATFACNTSAIAYSLTPSGTCTFTSGMTLLYTINSQGDCVTAANIRNLDIEIIR